MRPELPLENPLDSELRRIAEEEAKLEASLAKLKPQAVLSEIERIDLETQQLEKDLSFEQPPPLSTKHSASSTRGERQPPRSKWSLKSEPVRSKPVHRIGAVYNEVAARSGRYGQANPAPHFQLKAPVQRTYISFRKPPRLPTYTGGMVRVNPNLDVRAMLREESAPQWARGAR